MNGVNFFNRVRLGLLLVSACLALAAEGLIVRDATAATSKPAKVSQSLPATSAPAEAEQLRDTGLKDALDGKFQSALGRLDKAVALNPDDNTARSAAGLLRSYIEQVDETSTERGREYQYEVDRIRWAFLAQKYRDETANKPLLKQLRQAVTKGLAEAYHAIGTAETFEGASAKEAAGMKSASLAEIDNALKALGKAEAVLGNRKGEYADEFRSEVRTCRKVLDACGAAWSSAEPATAKGRWKCAMALQPIEDNLADAVTDLEVLVARNPWKIALLHGRIASQITPDKDKLPRQGWYRELIKDAERRGLNAVKDAKWYDALNVYLALEELEPDNEAYRAELKKVRRHVHVLRLYGSGVQDDDEDEPDDAKDKKDSQKQDDSPPPEPAWKNMVEGVDAEMVRSAISRLGQSYVKEVDFRKLTRGALEGIKILAQTPQVAGTFPGLGDPAKKQAFIAALDKALDDIKKPDRVRHLDLIRALNDVLYNSEQTVNIPIDVLAVEFADGFLGELDKFSSMIWPYDVTNFNKQTMGHFTGIGVQITKEPDQPLKVVTPLLNTPAMKAGIKAGDLIMEVDGLATKKQTIDKLIKQIMGPPGSTVTLTIKRRGVAKPFPVPVVRQAVHIRTVKGWRRRDNGEWNYLLDDRQRIGYIRVTQFTGKTDKNIRKALEQLKDAGVTSLVLDLRANPGGLLRSATKVANQFLEKGDIVSTRGRQVPRNYERADSGGAYLHGDLVVLVDQISASAAEILSGALKDWHRAVIVGQRSYGKGSVQNVIPIRRDKAFLKLTTAYYYLPKGRLLHKQNGAKDWGVDPDVEVFVTPRQARRWVRLRRKTDLLQKFEPQLLKADLDRQYEEDLQLNTAVLLLELMKLKHQADSPQAVASES